MILEVAPLIIKPGRHVGFEAFLTVEHYRSAYSGTPT